MPRETPRRVRWERLATVLCAAGALAQAQPFLPPAPPPDHPQFRAAANLILVPLTVTDARGSNIQGLGAENFTVMDNRQPQRIVAFYSDDTPVSVGIVLDVSGSTAGILDREKAAVRAFLDRSNPEDDYFLATVSSNPRVLADRVDDSREIDSLLPWQKAGGGTALCDTVYFALHRARLHPQSRRALLVISDGMDNNSRYSKQELTREVEESDTQIYTIALVDSQASAKGLSGDEARRGLAFMQDLAEKGGGMSIRLGANENPAAAAARISAAMRNQYVLGYRSPDSGGSDRWHKIQVKVNLREASVHARTGYQLR
jgi:Ca-activated chloride channel homolog